MKKFRNFLKEVVNVHTHKIHKHHKMRRDTRVLGRFVDDSEHFGTVTQVWSDKLVNVHFDDGETCKDFEIKDLVPIAQNASITGNAEQQ